MPEPRETHAAIDARRNAERGGGDREALARLIAANTGAMSGGWEAADAIIAAGWIPGDRPCPVHDWQEARAERDALAATVARVRALADEWEAEADEDEDWLNGPRVAVSEAQQYPATIRTTRGHVADLRAALAPSDPATGEA